MTFDTSLHKQKHPNIYPNLFMFTFLMQFVPLLLKFPLEGQNLVLVVVAKPLWPIGIEETAKTRKITIKLIIHNVNLWSVCV